MVSYLLANFLLANYDHIFLLSGLSLLTTANSILFPDSGFDPSRSAIFSAVDTIVPISEHGYNYIFNNYPKFSSKVFLSRLGVFDNGLNYNLQNLTKEFTIVSVSNVVALKRLNLLFDALQKTQSKITWHHFGDGVLINDLSNAIKNKRQGLNVILHGYVSNQTLINFYQKQQVDLFVNVLPAVFAS